MCEDYGGGGGDVEDGDGVCKDSGVVDWFDGVWGVFVSYNVNLCICYTYETYVCVRVLQLELPVDFKIQVWTFISVMLI